MFSNLSIWILKYYFLKNNIFALCKSSNIFANMRIPRLKNSNTSCYLDVVLKAKTGNF